MKTLSIILVTFCVLATAGIFASTPSAGANLNLFSQPDPTATPRKRSPKRTRAKRPTVGRTETVDNNETITRTPSSNVSTGNFYSLPEKEDEVLVRRTPGTPKSSLPARPIAGSGMIGETEKNIQASPSAVSTTSAGNTQSAKGTDVAMEEIQRKPAKAKPRARTRRPRK